MSIDPDNIPASMRRAMDRKPALRVPGAPDPGVPADEAVTNIVACAAQPPKKKRAPGLSKPRGRRKMNKTEAAFALILEARKRAGEITRYEWEGVTLRWPDGLTYSPDFVVWGWNASMENPVYPITMIETKNAWIEGDALVKFRAARANWSEFVFELHQLKKGTWTKLL